MTDNHTDEAVDRRSGEPRRVDDVAEPSSDALPQWAKVIGVVGVPSTIALYLTYALVNIVFAAANKTNEQMATHVVQMNEFISEQREIKSQNDTVIRVLRTTCSQQAKTYDDRERCQR